MDILKARRILGERLKAYRKMAGLSVAQLGEKVNTPRQYIYDIEAGRVNYTVDQFARLLAGCGTSFEELLAGTNTSAVPVAFQDLFQMLQTIISSGNADLLHGIRVNLDAISDKALRMMKARASPSPEARVGQEAGGGTHTGGQRRRKRAS
jgi:transcriptional regulator with XRE-family HTH domain